MNTPRFLVGAALLFWGWQSDLLVVGAVMAVVLEGARFIKLRWELSNEDFSRIWTFCALLFLASFAYAFSASHGPANVSELFSDSSLSAQNKFGTSTTKTAVLLIRWVPMAFFLFIAAQTYSNREGIPLETISLILRRRWKKARESGQPAPESRMVNVTYPYFIACIFAATTHPTTANYGFFWGLCGLTVWVFWSRRSRRYGAVTWVSVMSVAIFLAYGSQRGLVKLQQLVNQYNPQWLGGLLNPDTSSLESRTAIGQIGRIKTSAQIVIRLEVPDGEAPPWHLREASYRTFNSGRIGIWSAGSSKDDFINVSETSLNSGIWPLLPGTTNHADISIASYLPGGNGLLPLPEDCGLLEKLPAYTVLKNSVGTVKASGPGLVIFHARYGAKAAMDDPPNTNEDLGVPPQEKPALDEVVSSLHLTGKSRAETVQAISRYFGTQFSYSLWQDQPKITETNHTAIGRFLLKTHNGHCEYFATATVLLLRELHIPARYAVGYAVHEAHGNKYVVRQNDAHAWCRLWNAKEQSWEDFDTTPGDWLEAERKHRSSFQFLGDTWSLIEFEFSKLRWGQSNLRQYILWALAPILVFLLYQIIFRSGKRHSREGQKAAEGRVVHPGVDSEFYQFEAKLVKHGFVRQASEPMSSWLTRVAAERGLSKASGAWERVMRLHYQYRFDPNGLNIEEREMLRREVAICLSSLS